jgi:hypothetical protein
MQKQNKTKHQKTNQTNKYLWEKRKEKCVPVALGHKSCIEVESEVLQSCLGTLHYAVVVY